MLSPECVIWPMRKGVRVAMKSDSGRFYPRHNSVAPKPSVTAQLNCKKRARSWDDQPRVDSRRRRSSKASIDVGKDADLVISESGHPLSPSYGVPEKVLIDGEIYFDRQQPGLGTTHYKEGE